jgi:hypothetical protein
VKAKFTDEQALAALEKNGGVRSRAAQDLGVAVRTLMFRLDTMRNKGIKIPESTYDGRPAGITGTSTLLGADGSVRLQWVKEKHDGSQERLEAMARALAEKLPRIAPAPAPKRTDPDRCTLYTLTDCHVGMLAWGRETGGPDWDLSIAEQVLTRCFLRLIETSPAAKDAIFLNLGDFLHFDSLVPETPTSRHILDADGRFQKVVECAVRIQRRIVERLLRKHERVFAWFEEGNHDPAAAIWQRIMFAALFEDEPRLTVDLSPSPYGVHQHGKVMIGFHHGHLAKNQSLPLLFAAKFPTVWGPTSAGRYIHVGHRHHVDEKEHPGVYVHQHATLAAPDAYASRGGWMSKQQATAVTYHAEFGECERTKVVPEMFG